MKESKIAAATFLALGTALISGFSNYIAKIGVTAVKDPLLFTTLKNAIVAVLLVGILFAVRKWREIRTLKRSQWLTLSAIGIVGGSVPFALFFIGLSKTTALNASLIHKTLFLWVVLLAVPFLKERVASWQWVGIGLIAASNFLVGGFTGFKYNGGELMILAATVLWAVENVIAKVTLRDVSSTTVAAARMVFGSVLLIAFAAFMGKGVTMSSLTFVQWKWTLIASALLLGYVLTWYAALKRAPATYVATLLVPATLITNVLSAVLITHTFPRVQMLQALTVTVGIALVIRFLKRAGESSDRSTASLPQP